MENNNLITVSTAARLHNMELAHFQYYVRKDRTPPFQIIDGRKFFDKDEILNWRPHKMKAGRKKSDV